MFENFSLKKERTLECYVSFLVLKSQTAAVVGHAIFACGCQHTAC